MPIKFSMSLTPNRILQFTLLFFLCAASSALSFGQSNCRAPGYNCLNRTEDIVQISSVPDVGNHSGTVTTDPDFHTTIIRLTGPDSCRANGFSLLAGVGGSALPRLSNANHTRIYVEDTGSDGCILNFDPATKGVSTCATGIQGGTWDATNPDYYYGPDRTGGVKAQIIRYDFSAGCPGTQQVIVNLGSDPACQKPAKVKWFELGGVSNDATIFSLAYSSGIQNSAVEAVVYKVGSGCVVWNTSTGMVSGEWGTPGPVNFSAGAGTEFHIHQIRMSQDGQNIVVAGIGCISACVGNPFSWTPETAAVQVCTPRSGIACSGHWAVGASHLVNNGGLPFGEWSIRPLTDMAATAAHTLISPFPVSTRRWRPLRPTPPGRMRALMTRIHSSRLRRWRRERRNSPSLGLTKRCSSCRTGADLGVLPTP
ncbi:MAG TPA: hypothetical protein VH079_04960 [Terriglobales bacterium]|nr:hypothetical protein [Terriglobales bacterium]